MEGHSLRKHRDLAARRERHFIISALAGLGGLLGATAAAGFGTAAAAGVGAAAVGAAAGLGSLGYSIAAGERGAKMQEEAMRQQQKAQQTAVQQARSQQRRSQQAMAAANRAEPDVAGIMGAAGQAAGGPSSTMLTGPTGVNPMDLQLGRSTLLGS